MKRRICSAPQYIITKRFLHGRVGYMLIASCYARFDRAWSACNLLCLSHRRLSPAVASAFRVAKKDLRYNGYLIPQGEKLCWNINNGNKAESLYPEPQR